MSHYDETIVFPLHAEHIRFSWKTRYFFLVHGIKIASGESFPLDYLRYAYQDDAAKGALIYEELFLYGFNFHTEKPLPLFPEDASPSDEVLLSLNKSPFPFAKVESPAFAKIIEDLEVAVMGDLNGMNYHRLLEKAPSLRLHEELSSLGYGILPWEHLEMDRRGNDFLYWPEGREGLACPNFFLPFLADLLTASPKLVSFYQRVGVRHYLDFFQLGFGQVEYMARLIAKQGMSPAEASQHQMALWSFAYDLEESKRELNAVDLDWHYLFYPTPEGVSPEERRVLSKYHFIDRPFASDLLLANAFNARDLPTPLKKDAALLEEYGFHDLSVLTKWVLFEPIDSFGAGGRKYGYALNPEFVLNAVKVSCLYEGSRAPSIVAYSALDLEEKVGHFLGENNPERALDCLFDTKQYLFSSNLAKTKGLLAYILSGEGKYAYDPDLGVVGQKPSIAALKPLKERLLGFHSFLPFETLKAFYDETGISPLLLFQDKVVSVEYDPYPVLLLEKKKKRA